MDDDYPFEIAVTNTSGRAPTDQSSTASRIRRVLRQVLRQHRVRRARLSICLVDDATIGDLHRRFLGVAGPTDVLAFDLRDAPEAVPAGRHAKRRHCLDGEIVISAETAARQARLRGHGVDAEIALYAIHGALHLLGYDDHDARNAGRMHALEDQILEAAGVGAVFYRPPARRQADERHALRQGGAAMALRLPAAAGGSAGTAPPAARCPRARAE